MIFIPIRTDTPLPRRPVVNYALLAANCLIYLVIDLFAPRDGGGPLAAFKRAYMLDPLDLSLVQFFSYQFLHGDLLHLLGNMLFLWVFGNSVNAKMGNVTYLLFYLACGVFAGVGFTIGNTNPCLGASGAIAGITTAFMVLFPRSTITVVYWLFWFIGTAHFQAMLLIIVKIILWDNIVAPSLSGGQGYVSVAYSAHIAGYIFGFIVCALMLLVRALPRDHFDMLAVLKRAYQRQAYRATMNDPAVRTRAVYGRVARPPDADAIDLDETKAAPVDDPLSSLRAEIAALLDARNFDLAAQRYEELVRRAPSQVLSRRHMMDIANVLMQSGRHEQAAAAYEKYLRHYAAQPDAEQVQLVLGIIYGKYLRQYEKSRAFLQESLKKLTQPELIAQARQWLDTVSAASGHEPNPA